MEDWNTFVDWASKAILGGICVYGVHILSQMKTSIDSLNVKVGQIILKNEYAARDIEKLEIRIDKLEHRY